MYTSILCFFRDRLARSNAISTGCATCTSPSLTASAIIALVVGSGSHILRVDGYSATKGLGNGNYIASETFAAGGHRWCLHYYPDSFSHCHSSESICVALNLVHAEVDEVEAKFTISLLDQAGNPVPSYTHTFSAQTFDMAGRRCPRGFHVIERRDLERSAYLKNDALCVRCDVTVVKKIFTKAIPVSEVLRRVVK